MPALPEDKLPRNDVRHAAVAADPIRILAEPLALPRAQVRWTYAETLCLGDVTLDDFRKGVTTFEETERTARRVLGGAHPVTEGLEIDLRSVREVLHRRENGEHVIYTTPYLQ